MVYDPRAHGAQCDRCVLRDATPVPPTPAANGKPRLVIIGEGPGSVEVNFGAPFLGPSGRLLNGALREAGFDRDEAHVTNALLCRVEKDSDVKEALPCCAPRLAAELATIDPAVPILALGAPGDTRDIRQGRDHEGPGLRVALGGDQGNPNARGRPPG